MLKVAVVGVGGISGAHIPVWEAMEDAELVALCDINQERLDLYPGKRGYLEFDEMLEKEDLDIIDICLPTYLHAEYSIRAMEKRIPLVSIGCARYNKDQGSIGEAISAADREMYHFKQLRKKKDITIRELELAE